MRVLRPVLVLGHRSIIRYRIPACGADASKRLREHPRRLRCFQTRALTPFGIYCLAFGALGVIRFAPMARSGSGPGHEGRHGFAWICGAAAVGTAVCGWPGPRGASPLPRGERKA